MCDAFACSRTLVLTQIVGCAWILLLGATTVQGAGLHCDAVWSGPSEEHDAVECLLNTNRLSTNAGQYVLPALCVVFLVASLFAFPLVFCCCVCCQCGCDCCKDVPKQQREASKEARTRLSILTLIVLLLSIAIVPVVVTGAADLVGGADDVFVNLITHVVDFFNDLTYQLEDAVRDNATGNFTEPFTNETFSDIRDEISTVKHTTDDYRSQVTSYASLVSNVGYGVAVVPLLVFSFTALFAKLSCRTVAPHCCTCVYYLIGIVFSLIGFVLLLLASVFGDVCAEIDLQQQRQPGLFQWYAVPSCERTANFTDLKQQITSNEANFARDFCKEISKYCSSTVNFNAGTPADVFVCSTSDATAAADCPDFGAARSVLLNAYAKTGSNVCGATNCTFRQCPTACTDNTMKSNAQTALDILDKASRLFDALDIVLPLMDCNAVIDRVLRIFDSCPKVRDGLLKMGIAFFLTLIGIVFAWIIMFRGQKVWFSQQEYEEGERALLIATTANVGGVLAVPMMEHCSPNQGSAYAPDFLAQAEDDLQRLNGFPMLPQPHQSYNNAAATATPSYGEPLQLYGGSPSLQQHGYDPSVFQQSLHGPQSVEMQPMGRELYAPNVHAQWGGGAAVKRGDASWDEL